MTGSMTLPRRGPRFSIVPPQVAYDTRLEAIDVRLLLVFGNHIDNDGWCSRSQVRMAREMKVGRATIQRSIERLVRTGYLEYRATLNQVGGDGSHVYRVHFDAAPEADLDEAEVLDPVPASGQGLPGGDSVRAKIAAVAKGCPVPGDAASAGRGVPAHGTGTPCPPMERAPLERPLTNEVERETRASEGQEGDDLSGLDEFRAVYPSAAFDSRTRTERAWAPLSAADRKAAIAHAPEFLAGNKASGRRTTPSAATYLTERSWELLGKTAAAKAQAAPAGGLLAAWSQPWQAALLWRALRGEGGFDLRKMMRLADEMRVGFKPASDGDRAAIEALSATLKAVRSDAAHALDWADWLETKAQGLGLRARFAREPFYVFLPEHPPPGFGLVRETDDDVAAAMGAG